jgi:potassium/chloride transporter 9
MSRAHTLVRRRRGGSRLTRYLSDINVVPPMVMVGIFCATLSAALSCLIGASRIIQAIARDRLLGDWCVWPRAVFPHRWMPPSLRMHASTIPIEVPYLTTRTSAPPYMSVCVCGCRFTVFSSEKGEPVRAVFLSWILVQMVLFIGQINVIAPIVSMLYLIS